jgi:hypothetical protein
VVYGLIIHGLAAVAVVIIIWLFLLIWPIPLLGYTYDLATWRGAAVM